MNSPGAKQGRSIILRWGKLPWPYVRRICSVHSECHESRRVDTKMNKRRKAGTARTVQGSTCEDVATVLCCGHLANCQLAQEIQERGDKKCKVKVTFHPFLIIWVSLLYTSILWHQQKYHNNHSIFKESSWVFSGRLFNWLLLHSRLNTINKSEHDSWFGGCMHVNNGASLLSFLSS